MQAAPDNWSRWARRRARPDAQPHHDRRGASRGGVRSTGKVYPLALPIRRRLCSPIFRWPAASFSGSPGNMPADEDRVSCPTAPRPAWGSSEALLVTRHLGTTWTLSASVSRRAPSQRAYPASSHPDARGCNALRNRAQPAPSLARRATSSSTATRKGPRARQLHRQGRFCLFREGSGRAAQRCASAPVTSSWCATGGPSVSWPTRLGGMEPGRPRARCSRHSSPITRSRRRRRQLERRGDIRSTGACSWALPRPAAGARGHPARCTLAGRALGRPMLRDAAQRGACWCAGRPAARSTPSPIG